MADIHQTSEQEQFWSNRYQANTTGWDIGYPSTPIKEYIDQLTDKNLRILIPGAGNAYEAEYLWQQGFQNTHILDIAANPLEAFQNRVPDFPDSQAIHGNFFTHEGAYDLVLEQTFFCSFEPEPANREAYAAHMARLIPTGGKLAGLWFDVPLFPGARRPFGGTKEEYLGYLEPYFEVHVFERAHNSISPRTGGELFGIFVRR